VRARSELCPFCETPLELAPQVVRRSPGRLGRAAIFAFRTLVIGSAGATVGCGASSGLTVPDGAVTSPDAGRSLRDGGPDAGRPPPPRRDAGVDGGFDGGFDGGSDAGGIVAAYGGPVLLDGGPSNVPAYGTPPPPILADAGDSDAGWDGGGSIVNLYGAAPAD